MDSTSNRGIICYKFRNLQEFRKEEAYIYSKEEA